MKVFPIEIDQNQIEKIFREKISNLPILEKTRTYF